MSILGITGGTGSGKTTLLNCAKAMGITVIDCDAVYHDLLANNAQMLAEIKSHFPAAFSSGTFDRKALGKIVFADSDKLAKLNTITHRYVLCEVERILQKSTHAAIDAIGLFESGLDKLCDTTVAVTAPMELRIKRLVSVTPFPKNTPDLASKRKNPKKNILLLHITP